MLWTSFIDFISKSVPEQFLMALFVWVILGRKESIRFRNVVFVGLSTAILFYIIRVPFNQNYFLAIIPQITTFVLLIYFGYKVNIHKALIGTLIAFLVIMTAQGTIANILGLFAGITEEEVLGSDSVRMLFSSLYLPVFCLLIYLLYKNNINIYYLKKKKMDKTLVGRVRFVTLQLIFTLFVISINFTVFYRNISFFKSTTDKILLVLSIIVTVIFTGLVIRSVFKMGDKIKEEEKHQRQLDGREIIQNIDYLCSLIDKKDYDGAKKILHSIKNDIDDEIVKNKDGSNIRKELYDGI